jgi:hypothetical protein
VVRNRNECDQSTVWAEAPHGSKQSMIVAMSTYLRMVTPRFVIGVSTAEQHIAFAPTQKIPQQRMTSGESSVEFGGQ